MSADGSRQMLRPQTSQDTVLWCMPNILGTLPTAFTCNQAPPRSLCWYSVNFVSNEPGMAPSRQVKATPFELSCSRFQLTRT
jgi:hypothetical protein